MHSLDDRWRDVVTYKDLNIIWLSMRSKTSDLLILVGVWRGRARQGSVRADVAQMRVVDGQRRPHQRRTRA